MALMHPITKAYLLMMREGIDQKLKEDSDTLGTSEYQMELAHKQDHKGMITADIAMWDTNLTDGLVLKKWSRNTDQFRPGVCRA